MTEFTHLATPLKKGRLHLKNRIIHASILTRFAKNEQTTERLISYHTNRARGGASLIITEAVNALPMQAGRSQYLNAHSDAGIKNLSRLAAAVHSHDCRILAQLQERGRGNYDRKNQNRPVAPSALPDDLAGVIPRALKTSEIEQMINDFAAAACRLERAGFNGVEISAGHGHLFHQFLSAHSNHRIDRFGGDLDKRICFLLETIEAVRSSTGSDFLIALKLPAEDGDQLGINLDDAAYISKKLTATDKVDMVSFAWGAQNHALHWHVPDAHMPRAPYLEKTQRLRGSTNGVPVVALGRIVDPNEAEAVLASGNADLVGLGRALIADPNWAQKALSGRSHTIRACVSCNTCWGAIAKSQALICDTNPAVGHSFELFPPPSIPNTLKRRHVVIIGGGVAGVAAAASLAKNGHKTTVLHRGKEIGGRAAIAASLPGGDGLQSVYGLDTATAQEAGAKIELGFEAKVSDIISLSPDNVVLATGANPEGSLDVAGKAVDQTIAPPLTQFICTAFRYNGLMGQHVVIIDLIGSIWCYRAAEYLTTKFNQVTILATEMIPAANSPLVVRQSLLERLARGTIRVLLDCTADPIENELANGLLGFFKHSTGIRETIEGVDALTYASPLQPRVELLKGLAQQGIAPFVIGDALQARNLLNAVDEGQKIGRTLQNYTRLYVSEDSAEPGQGRG